LVRKLPSSERQNTSPAVDAVHVARGGGADRFDGQLYNRQYLKAVVMGLVAVVCAVMTGGFAALIVAQRLHRGEPVRQWQFY
jgi:hypothetical protein